MSIRHFKIILVLIVALQGLLYAAQNLVNLDAAYGFVATVLSMEGHTVYPASLGPAIGAPALVWLALGIIILLELGVGILSLMGAREMYRVRKRHGDAFNRAKPMALWGAGLGVIIWYGLFMVIGGAYFQMWQTDIGQGSLTGAFQYGSISALAWIIIAMKDE